MELFGLRDRNGIDYKIVKENHDLYWTAVPLPFATKSMFRVGDWIIGEDNKMCPHNPCRITDIRGRLVIYDDDGLEKRQSMGIRHATSQEIESHLRKICDEKYIGKKVADSFSGTCGYARYFDFYDFKTDCVYYKNFGNGVCVYRQGKFAEIILDKRPLPKTKEELKDTLFRFNQKYSRTPLADTLTEFLEDYED